MLRRVAGAKLGEARQRLAQVEQLQGVRKKRRQAIAQQLKEVLTEQLELCLLSALDTVGIGQRLQSRLRHSDLPRKRDAAVSRDQFASRRENPKRLCSGSSPDVFRSPSVAACAPI